MSGEAPHEADSAPSATVDAAAAPGEQRPGVAAAGGAGEAAVPDSEPDKVEAALKVADVRGIAPFTARWRAACGSRDWARRRGPRYM